MTFCLADRTTRSKVQALFQPGQHLKLDEDLLDWSIQALAASVRRRLWASTKWPPAVCLLVAEGSGHTKLK